MNTPTTEMIEAGRETGCGLSDEWLTLIYSEMRAADTREDALREALEKIALRAKPHPDDTDDDRKRDLYHIASIARVELAQEPTDG